MGPSPHQHHSRRRVQWFATAGLAVALLATAAGAQEPVEEPYPGADAFQAGVDCYRDLNYDCAAESFYEALRLLNARSDPRYRAHVLDIRLRLARIYIALDDLGKGEEQFRALLSFAPTYDLDAESEPPKVVYVFQRAREVLTKALTPRPPIPLEPESESAPEPEPVPVVTDPATTPPEPPTEPEPAPPAEWLMLGVELLYVQPFGDDADAVDPGFCAGASFGVRPVSGLLLDLTVFYSRHGQKVHDSNLAFDVVGGLLGLETTVPLPHVALVLGGALGAQGMGKGAATDRGAFVGRLNLGLEVPLGLGLALGVMVHPTLVAVSDAASFLLDLGVRARWSF